MKTVREVSRITGVSVRTLHHYDTIGLLKPAAVSASGYRLYDDRSLERLQSILIFRELEFSLQEIRQILESPSFDPGEALQQQIRLLELRRRRLTRLINYARHIYETGEMNMDFSAFEKKKLDRYAAEAKKNWGKTDAYREYSEKNRGQTQAQQQETADGLMDIFCRLGAIRHLSPAGEEAQSLIRELQEYITRHYYTCTLQILRGLGQMYVAGGEMTENIDTAGGTGTAAFAWAAIDVYTK